ncbi:endonuclease/exonuclease/phosphatase family protein [Jonesia quinghaiensis]|uniref:endonuclease/exonuclease/phosphatase family protein n=1 Tax=Jonesia quinghaiensis TaxID=262806 RepID=UPI000402DC0E|nr:endonuclease/exonuclease/phosphatase family protein [Jonesia quinghaiensis]
MHLRIATYNVKGFRGDRHALLRVLRSLDADVLAIQEPPRSLSGPRRVRSLADALGMECVVPGGFPFGGVTTALLVRNSLSPRVRAAGARVLPWDLRSWVPQLRERLAWPSRRGFSWVDLQDVVVVNVHLGLNAAERQRHRTLILDTVTEWGPGRCIVVGDINEQRDGDSWQAFAQVLTPVETGPTFPGHRPRRCIDAVFAPPRATVLNARVDTAADAVIASDHLPVVCELTVL